MPDSLVPADLSESQVRERIDAVHSELERLNGYNELTRTQELRVEELAAEFDELDARRRALKRERDLVKVRSALEGGVQLPGSEAEGAPAPFTDARAHGGNPWPIREGALAASGQDLRGRALAALDRTGDAVPGEGQKRLQEALQVAAEGTFEGDLLSRWITATSDPTYRAAFFKLLRDEHGHRELSSAELASFQRVRALQRQMEIGTDAGGGFMVPFQLDPSIMLTSDGSVDPLRRLSRVVTAISDVWHGVSSAGVTAEWLAEHAEAADATPSVAQPEVTVHKGSAFVPYSVEFGMDAANGISELQRLLLDAADQLQAEAHMTGSGTGQPEGLASGLAAGSKVSAGTADAIDADDVVGLQNALPPRFQPRAQWCANLTVLNTIGSLETTNGSLRFPEVGSGRLLRKGLNEASHLDSPGDTAAADNDDVLLYGDYQAGYVIADRVGTTVELVPHLFGANRRPTGQRGLWIWFRTGSAVVVDEAFRLLTA